jgi:membrane protein implicated in regulation of membrane protease activity
MTTETNPRPLGDLLGGLAGDISGLFRKEIELAKTEASEKLGSVLGGLELLIAGAILAMAALGVLFAAIVTGIGAFFVAQGMDPLGANSLAALIVFIIAAIIAWILVARGRAALSASSLKLDRTTTSLGRDAAAVKEKL